MPFRIPLLTLLCSAGWLALAATGDFGSGLQKPPGNALEDAAFLVGNWHGVFKIHPSAAIPAEPETPAAMRCAWGRQRAWIESEATMEIPGLGPYAAKVIVRFDPRAQAYDSFVVNTFGSAGRYSGSFREGKLVFVGNLGAITQRVTYENVSPRELRFRVEESRDGGASYRPHSEILWERD